MYPEAEGRTIQMQEFEKIQAIQAAVGGNEDSLQRLLVHYHQPLCRVVARRMPTALRKLFDPEDILQQAYVTAFHSIGDCEFGGSAAFFKWLQEIALARLAACCRDMRRQKRDLRRERPLIGRGGDHGSSYQDLAALISAGSTTPSKHLARRETAAAIISSMARLTEEQREVIRMRLMENRTAAEVGAILRKSEAAVNMLTYRGLQSLRRFLDHHSTSAGRVTPRG